MLTENKPDPADVAVMNRGRMLPVFPLEFELDPGGEDIEIGIRYFIAFRIET